MDSAGFYLVTLPGFIDSAGFYFFTQTLKVTSKVKTGSSESLKTNTKKPGTLKDFKKILQSSKKKPGSLPGKKMTLQDFLFPSETFFLVVLEPTGFFKL